MSPTANVRAIRSLEDLRGALGRFGGEARESLQAAEQEIRRTLDWLQEWLNYWQREVERCQRAYDACMRSQDRDGRGSSCNAEAAALRRAEAELANVRRWLAQVQQAVGSYHVQARRLQDLATTHTEKAQAFLERKVAELEQYRAVAPATMATPVSGDARLLARMEQGRVDLSRGAEWGKFAHHAYEEALEEAFPGQARSEVKVRVTLPDGTQKEGRIDSLLGSTVIDYKTHNLEQLNKDGRLQHTLDEIRSQVQAYCASPDTPPGATAVVLFEFSPADSACRQFVEEYLATYDIQVLWGAD